MWSGLDSPLKPFKSYFLKKAGLFDENAEIGTACLISKVKDVWVRVIYYFMYAWNLFKNRTLIVCLK